MKDALNLETGIEQVPPLNKTGNKRLFSFLTILIVISVLGGYYVGNVLGYKSGFTQGNRTGQLGGFIKGNQTGFVKGYNSGFFAGNVTGTTTSYKNGYSKGYDAGNIFGNETGYASGQSEGYQSGYGTGKTDGYITGYSQGVKATGYNLVNPTNQQMMDFISSDPTNTIRYNSTFNCVNYCAVLIGDAEKAGYIAHYVSIDFTSGYGHAVVAFSTTDKGTVFIEPQLDRVVKLDVGKNYTSENDLIYDPAQVIQRYVIIP